MNIHNNIPKFIDGTFSDKKIENSDDVLKALEDIKETMQFKDISKELKLTSSVVTGMKNSWDTITGTFRIRGKARNTYLVGADYRSFVNYWMLVDYGSQIGLHDATWRSSFGGSIYKYNGSHGCVNLPYGVARTIYNSASVGTLVLIY